jgi:site-specific DNA-methyltransferase (adenine-specific)
VEDNTIIRGDCLEVLKDIPSSSVDLVLTDPPYGTGGRDGSVHLNNITLLGNRMSVDSYIWWINKVAGECYRITKDDSHLYTFSDWRSYKNQQIGFETAGWELRSLLVWSKGNGMGEFWRSSHEFILFMTKQKPRKLSHGGCFNVLSFSPVRGSLHPTQKPLDLFEELVMASTNEGDLVCDPFVGSGTTAVACIQTGRRYIGIEQSQAYCAIAERRVKSAVEQITLL